MNLRAKVIKILQICLKKFCELQPRSILIKIVQEWDVRLNLRCFTFFRHFLIQLFSFYVEIFFGIVSFNCSVSMSSSSFENFYDQSGRFLLLIIIRSNVKIEFFSEKFICKNFSFTSSVTSSKCVSLDSDLSWRLFKFVAQMPKCF